jgi:single-stranded DNA-binding protein
MHKGEPVLVRGKFKTSTYEDKDGRPRTETRITADTVGHDLSRGVANYIRHRSKQPPAEGDMPGDGTAELMPGSPELTGGPDELLDEEAIQRFGRDLDEADLATRAFTEGVEDSEDGDAEEEDAEEEDDDMADVAASTVPATPY